jgi:hypothetical protein
MHRNGAAKGLYWVEDTVQGDDTKGTEGVQQGYLKAGLWGYLELTGTAHNIVVAAVSESPVPRVPVGGIVIPVDKFGLLAPYIGLASTTTIGAAATAVYVKRVRRRKEKQ